MIPLARIFTLIAHCSVLVGSRNRFECDLNHKTELLLSLSKLTWISTKKALFKFGHLHDKLYRYWKNLWNYKTPTALYMSEILMNIFV